MNGKISIELGETLKKGLPALLEVFAQKNNWVSHADVRVNISEGQGASAQNGGTKGSGRDYGLELHTRVIAGKNVQATGYYGISLGPTDVNNFYKIVEMTLERSYTRAIRNAENKYQRSKSESWGKLGDTLWSTKLAPVSVHVKTVPAEFQIWPLDVELSKISETAKSISKEIKERDSKIKMNYIGLMTWVEREIFASTEGILIDQTLAYTEGFTYAVAVSDKGVTQKHYDSFCHQRGWEIVENGVNERFIKLPNFRDFSLVLARDASELCVSPSCPSTDKPVTIVTDPHYNTLKVHEIVGHPVELDRVLKMETAYAGRSHFFKNFEDNMLGLRVGSPLVNAYSDPSLPGFGHYEYDHEGTPAKKIWHIKNGVLTGFMNSRQTAAITGDEPNGHWKASGGQVVPLIRMSVTVFAEGNKNPADIISDVEHGYYLVGHRIPSIAESRENFRISARKVYEIKNGKLGQLYRDGGIMSDTIDYFMSVDAVGNDFTLYPIPNCGKGQPMQTKRLGNGGPTMRARAKLTGGGK